MTVEAAHQTTAHEFGVTISSLDSPPKFSEEVVFDGTDESKGVQVKTHITKDILARIASMEQNAHGKNGRSFLGARDQFKEELNESRENFARVKRGKTDLSVDETVHNQRDEIGDGLISSVGLIRKFMSDDEAANFVADVDYNRRKEPQFLVDDPKKAKKNAEKGIRRYHRSGKKLLRSIKEASVKEVEHMSGSDQENILKNLRKVLGDGLNAMDLLNVDANWVIDNKVRVASNKYSRIRTESKGSYKRAKKDWERRQLPVIGDEVILLAA